MSEKLMTKPVSAIVGAAFVSAIAVPASASAADNPFQVADLDDGYMLAAHHEKGEEGKCGEGKCGGEKKAEEGKCGGEKKAEEGKCGGEAKAKEGSCGGEKKAKEGACGGEKKAKEGSCGGAHD
jgi:uncharacterized low-complexity protein